MIYSLDGFPYGVLLANETCHLGGQRLLMVIKDILSNFPQFVN
jgi:hypothetical protein